MSATTEPTPADILAFLPADAVRTATEVATVDATLPNSWRLAVTGRDVRLLLTVPLPDSVATHATREIAVASISPPTEDGTLWTCSRLLGYYGNGWTASYDSLDLLVPAVIDAFTKHAVTLTSPPEAE